MSGQESSLAEQRRRYRRPLILGIGASVGAELGLLIVYGMILSPGGDLVAKVLWTLVFCGLGMGSAVGAGVVLLVVDRLDGARAVLACAAIAAALPGGLCNALCFRLDANYFHYFGAHDSPILFIVPSVLLASAGGAAMGWLMFTERGRALLRRVGI